MRSRWRLLAAGAALALLLGGCDSATSGHLDPLRVGQDHADVPVTVVRGPDGLRAPLVHVSVAGGPDVTVILDTGSIGLVLRSAALGSAAHDTGHTFDRRYGGFSVHARLESATVRMVGGPTSSALDVGVVDSPINSFITAVGAMGILGVAPGQYTADRPTIVSPLAELPGSLADGYLLDLRAGRLRLGEPSLSGATTVALRKASWTYPDGASGYQKSIKAQWTVGGQTRTLPTLLDTGGRAGSYDASFLPSNAVENGHLAAGTGVRLALGGRTALQFTAGQGGAPPAKALPGLNVMNTGLPAFLASRIGVDQRAGRFVIAPY